MKSYFCPYYCEHSPYRYDFHTWKCDFSPYVKGYSCSILISCLLWVVNVCMPRKLVKNEIGLKASTTPLKIYTVRKEYDYENEKAKIKGATVDFTGGSNDADTASHGSLCRKLQ